MKIRITIAGLMAALLLGGCMSTQVSMFPVEGPYSRQVPLPTVTAKVENIISNSGPMSVLLPDGQACAGKWASVAPQQTTVTSASLFSLYGGAAGFTSVSVGNVPGVNRGEAFMSCNRGTTIQVEFFTGSGTANGYGVAKDSVGNIYKLIF